MSTQPQHAIAREAARKLAPEMPDGIADVVEAELAADGARTPQTFMDPATAIGLAGLILNAAALAWTIYRDLKKETPKPARDVVARKVRLRLIETGEQEDPQLRRIVDVVVDLTAEADPE